MQCVKMASGMFGRFVFFGEKTALVNKAGLSTSCTSLIKWRYEKNVEPNPNRYGKLTNLPDYSFVDGRTVPLGMNLYQRIKLQEVYCKKIVELSNEIDFALERHKKMVKESEMQKQHLIESKLKEKGIKLLLKSEESK